MTTDPTNSHPWLPPGVEHTLAAARIATAVGTPVGVATPAEIDAASIARRRRRAESSIGAWLLTISAMLLAMIVLGALTRLSESGLSMVEWRPVTGWLPPISEQAWQTELDKYAQSPQGRIVNRGMSVAAFKEIFWLEYVHRLWGRLIGVAFAVPLIWFWSRGVVPGWLKPRLLALLGLGALQGLLGWLMVASGLVDRPAVSHFRLAAHLLLATGILAWMLWLAWELLWPRIEPHWRYRDGNAAIRSWASWLIVLLTALMGFGAFVAGLRAGRLHTTFPTMSGYWIPPDLLQASNFWLYLVTDPSGVQFVHRWLATMMVLAVALMWWRCRKVDVSLDVRRMAGATLVAATLQFSLGVAALLGGVPVWLGVLHQAGAVVLMGALLGTLFLANAGSQSGSAAYRFRTA